MFEDGLVDEVRRLLDEGLAEGRTASRAIGYQQVIAHLARRADPDEARERTATATRGSPAGRRRGRKDTPDHLDRVRRTRPGRAGARRGALRWFRGSSLALLAPQPPERAAG